MSRPAAGRVPRLRPEVRFRRVGGEAVVIVQDAGEALVLNEVGSRILELVDGERSIEEIAARLRGEYETGEAEVEADVASYIAELAAAAIVELDAGQRQRE